VIVDLHIKDFAIIDELQLEPGPGLNVLTGETGTGKSIVIDAVEIALGGKAFSEYVRHGADRAVVELTFSGIDQKVQKCLEEMGISQEDDLVISREILSTGRSITRLNGRSATAQMLRNISAWLIDIHGQHEHQSLLNPERHLDLLDGFGGTEVSILKSQIARGFEETTRLRRDLNELGMNEQERTQRWDMLAYQVQEIRAAQLCEGEEEDLLAKRRVMANRERLVEQCSGAFALLHEGQGVTCQELVGEAMNLLEHAARLDPSLSEKAEEARQVSLLLGDLARSLRDYLEEIEFDSQSLAAMEERLDILSRLKRKYGGSVGEILAFMERASSEMERLERGEETARALEKEIQKAESAFVRDAKRLSSLRKKAAGDLESRVAQELRDLGMPRARLKVMFGERSRPGASGMDEVEFILSTNPGEPPRPLHKIASGGEMSRIMLAIKSALAEVDDIPTLIFDEVDAGIGGRAAHVVADKLKQVASRRQVICVTHLAAIASHADRHFCVDKVLEGERTIARIHLLEDEERLEELARMLGGDVTQATLGYAREFLDRKASPS
jgi:DNA repair protein RecN (Recombination protein N)